MGEARNKGFVSTFLRDPTSPPPPWSPPFSPRRLLLQSENPSALPTRTGLTQHHSLIRASPPPGVPLNSPTSTWILTPAAPAQLVLACVHLCSLVQFSRENNSNGSCQTPSSGAGTDTPGPCRRCRRCHGHAVDTESAQWPEGVEDSWCHQVHGGRRRQEDDVAWDGSVTAFRMSRTPARTFMEVLGTRLSPQR